jgi:hypothetical protein
MYQSLFLFRNSMGKDLEINGRSCLPRYAPSYADYSANNEEMTIDKFQQDVIHLIQTGKMENWHLAGHMLAVASTQLRDIPSQYEYEQKYAEDDIVVSNPHPGDSFSEFKSLLEEEVKMDDLYFMRIIRAKQPLIHVVDIADEVLLNFYKSFKQEYDEDLQRYIARLPKQMLTVSY